MAELIRAKSLWFTSLYNRQWNARLSTVTKNFALMLTNSKAWGFIQWVLRTIRCNPRASSTWLLRVCVCAETIKRHQYHQFVPVDFCSYKSRLICFWFERCDKFPISNRHPQSFFFIFFILFSFLLITKGPTLTSEATTHWLLPPNIFCPVWLLLRNPRCYLSEPSTLLRPSGKPFPM